MTPPPPRAQPDALVELGEFIVRPKRPSDAFDEWLWRRDPETVRLDGSGQPEESLADFLTRVKSELGPLSVTRSWYALETSDGVHFGSIGLFNKDSLRATAEIGISIGRSDHRDRGCGTRAMVGITRHIWETTTFRTLQLHTFEWNERAHQCFLKAGYQDVARVARGVEVLRRMEARREWWLLWDGEGRFDRFGADAYRPRRSEH